MTSHGNGGHESCKHVGCIAAYIMYEVVCVLCAVKLEDKASRMYVRDHTSFSTEDELKNVPINLCY